MQHERLYYKDVALIRPDTAASLGIAAEDTPVFASVDERGKRLCEECGVESGPLAYETGRVVMAEHFHRTGSRFEYGGGGIYHWVSPPEVMNERLRWRAQYRWVAMVEPVGDVEEHDYLDSTKTIRSEGVLVNSIMTHDSLARVITAGTVFDSGSDLLGLYSRASISNPCQPPTPSLYKFQQSSDGDIDFFPL
jgi:hypothetical protein